MTLEAATTAEYAPVSQQLPADGELEREGQTSPVIVQVPLSGERSWLNKLSTWTATTIVLSYICLPLSIGFLAFLWSNPKGLGANKTWFRIVLGDWTLKSITIASFIIRTAISTQAAISTSMLASIILERRQVMIYDSAPILALRFVNDGPFSLLFALKNTYRRAQIWMSAALLLFGTTLLLQFTSTGLVTDVGMGTLFASPKQHQTMVAVSFSNINLTDIRSVRPIPYWLEATPNFPVFAERYEAVPNNETSNSARDTGLTHRAFVPVSNSSMRTSIKEFVGIATVLDSRVTCVRPKMHPCLSLGYTLEDGFFLNGTLAPDFTPVGLILANEPCVTQDLRQILYNITGPDSRNSTINMNWAQQLQFAHDDGEWNVVQKHMLWGPGLVSSLDPRFPTIRKYNLSHFQMSNPSNRSFGLSYKMENDNFPLMTGRSYQLLNITSSANLPTLINGPGPTSFYFSSSQLVKGALELVISPQDEWLIFTIPIVPEWHVSVSLCFDSFVSVDANVTISTNATLTEPELGTWIATDLKFDTRAIRTQLGGRYSQVQSQADRAIMNLETTPHDLRRQVQDWFDTGVPQNMSDVSIYGQNFIRDSIQDKRSFGTYMCAGCGLQVVSNVMLGYSNNNPLQQQVWQDVMRYTNDSALAWQAYFTLLSRTVYYDVLSYFDVVEDASISWFLGAQFPRSYLGLRVVMTVLSIHCLLVALIIFAFIARTRYSRVGDNAWQCLSQANYHKSDNLFHEVTRMTDGEVERYLETKGLSTRLVSLEVIQEYPRWRTGIKAVEE
ncbi:hypothetical protein BGZ63DRAFT_426157 [Mariannaea sp. PMI_226]|nr:hypothetical protein BGZ63DRAFT_426157 [Mariannaea sp. PMI_226]